MEKKTWLSSYTELRHECRYLRRLIVHLDSRLTPSAANVTGMPKKKGGVQDSVGEGVAALLDARAMLAERQAETERKLLEISRFITAQEDPHIRNILYRRYISGWSWRRIGMDMELDEATVRRHHRDFVEHMPQNPQRAGYDGSVEV